MCAKLLLNLIDCIDNLAGKDVARRLLVRLLDAFTIKFGNLRRILPKLKIAAVSTIPFSLSNPAPVVEIENCQPIKTNSVGIDHHSSDTIKGLQHCLLFHGCEDYKFLFKTLVLGLKTIVFALKRCSAPSSHEEEQVYSHLLMNGLSCFEIFRIDGNGTESSSPSPSTPATASTPSKTQALKEEKEVLEHFVAVFTLVDAAVFLEIFGTQIGAFIDYLIDNATALVIPQYFLANETVSRNFTGTLIRASF